MLAIQDESLMERIVNRRRFKCCFCGTTVESSSVEPLQLVVFERQVWERSSDTDAHPPSSQSLWAHVDCVGARLHASIPFLSHADRLADPQTDG